MVIEVSCARAAETNAPEVTGVTCGPGANSRSAGLGDRVTVNVTNLAALIAQGAQEHHNIVLFLNDQPLSGLDSLVDPVKGGISFMLARSSTNRSTWAALLGRPDSYTRSVTAGVGIEGRGPIATAGGGADTFNLIVIRPGWFIGSLVIVVLALVYFFAVGRKSSMLRDSGPDPGAGRLRPYSLAKSQMAFWFFLILLAFMVIWAITGGYDSITNSALALMGIGAGTALGVAVQNKSKEGESKVLAQIQPLEQQKQAAIAAGGNPAAITAQIQALAPASENFLTDILTDANGLSFHRFQMAVWTVVLGFIFVKEVYCNLAMPDFNPTLLALLGISSGTYLGFMMNEGHSTDQ